MAGLGGMGGMAGWGTGQTVIDPRASILLGRALRPEPIETPMALIGRLAALGVGQRQQRGFEDEIAASRLQFGQALQAAGADPSARLAVLSQGAGSRDPAIRAASLEQIAKLSEIETDIVGTPGGGSVAVTKQGGQIVGQPQALVAGRAEAPSLLKFNDGEQERTLAFDPQTGSLVDLASAPRETLQRILPPEVYQQQVGLRRASGEAAGAATGAAMAAAFDKSAAQAGGGITGRADAQIELTRPAYRAAANALLAAGDALRANPTSRELKAAYIAAREGYATLAAQLQLPGEAVTSDTVKTKLEALPDPDLLGTLVNKATDSDPLRAAISAIDASLGGRGGDPLIPPAAATPAPGAAPGTRPRPTAAQLRRAAELLEKAERDAANAR